MSLALPNFPSPPEPTRKTELPESVAGLSRSLIPTSSEFGYLLVPPTPPATYRLLTVPSTAAATTAVTTGGNWFWYSYAPRSRPRVVPKPGGLGELRTGWRRLPRRSRWPKTGVYA